MGETNVYFFSKNHFYKTGGNTGIFIILQIKKGKL